MPSRACPTALSSVGINGVRVYGYSDEEGADAYDLELSRRRAEVVAIELVDVGLDAKRIAIVGRGKREPVADNRTPAGRAQNRRAAIVVSPRRGFNMAFGDDIKSIISNCVIVSEWR